MSTLIDKNLFKITFLLLILAEILSFFGWLLPSFNIICFFVIIFLTLILSLKKLEWGIYILLAELFIGSHGYLFSFSLGEILVSMRMGLFLVVMGVWLFQIINWVGSTLLGGAHCKPLNVFAKWLQPRGWSRLPAPRDVSPSEAGPYIASAGTSWRTLFIPLFAIILWAFVWGIIRGNNFGDVFLDFNNWLYFLLILPIFYCFSIIPRSIPRNSAIKTYSQENIFIKNIITILIASILWLSIKSLILLYIFSHEFTWALPEVYKWVRDTQIGEITPTGTGFYRVFMQSQIYALFTFFILLPLIKIQDTRYKIQKRSKSQIPNHKYQIPNKLKILILPITYYLLLITSLSTVLLSWSRSFWVGFIISLFLYFFISLFLKTKFSKLLKQLTKIAVTVAISFAIIFAIIKLPPKTEGANLASLLGRRVTQMEAASSSRINQLKPLLLAISKHPLIGSGFGTTVTYFSNDPRLIQVTAGGTGKITTYAFEWGYLDIILKFGVLGTFIYLYLIFTILKRLLISNFQFLISNKVPNPKSQTNSKLKIKNSFSNKTIEQLNNANLRSSYDLRIGFFLALCALLVINIFSPYLNHPLGIGFIIISALITNE